MTNVLHFKKYSEAALYNVYDFFVELLENAIEQGLPYVDFQEYGLNYKAIERLIDLYSEDNNVKFSEENFVIEDTRVYFLIVKKENWDMPALLKYLKKSNSLGFEDCLPEELHNIADAIEQAIKEKRDFITVKTNTNGEVFFS